jgi:hypothetical protein
MKLQQLPAGPDKNTNISGIREIVKNILNIIGGILVPFYLVIYLIFFMRRGPRKK